MSLRIFWPETTTDRYENEVDSTYTLDGVTPTPLVPEITAGRFADTSFISSPNSNPMYAQQLYAGFQHDMDVANKYYRAAFDLYHEASAFAIYLLALARNTSTDMHLTAATSTKTWLTVFVNPATKELNASVRNAAALEGNGAVQLGNEQIYRIEIEAYLHASAGTLKIWVNETLAMDESGIAFLSGDSPTLTARGWTYFGPRRPSKAGNLIVWDQVGTATTDLIGQLGDVTPVKLLPDATTSSQSTLVGDEATRHAALANPQGEENYVYFATSGHKDLYSFDTLAGSGTVKAVILQADGFLVGNGNASLVGTCLSNAVAVDSVQESAALTTYLAPTRVLSACFPVNPDGDVAWDTATINAASFGVKATIV